MTTRRCDIVDPSVSGVYHCISRCVRRFSLLDNWSRRRWLVQRLEFLSTHFGIDVISFAIMRNHMHLLLRSRPELIAVMSDREAAFRWKSLLRPRARRSLFGDVESNAICEKDLASITCSPARIAKVRADLSDLGFFHRLLKEPCARMWNREEEATGHLWEGRYKSPRVLDDEMLLSVSAYIDLNEIHAGAALGIDSSRWSSVRLQWQRLLDAARVQLSTGANENIAIEDVLSAITWEPVFPSGANITLLQDADVVPLTVANPPPLPVRSIATYVDFVDRMGRRTRSDKACRIQPDAPRALALLLNGLERVVARSGARQSIAELKERLRTAVHQVERSVESSICEIARATLDGVDPWLWSERARGSCYGLHSALQLESTRRGRARVSSVFPAPSPPS
jgi:REP element-mobilizing transposase RayT